MSVNKAILVGRLAKAPELRHTPSGTPTATWRMATGRTYTNREGEEVDNTIWHNVKVYGALAETCSKFLVKGRQVYVEGRIDTRMYEASDGSKRWWTEVVAQTVQFLGPRKPVEAEVKAPPAEYTESEIPF